MNARPLCAYVDGVGLLGPGFASWDEGAPILRGVRALVAQPTVLPPPEGLPPAERRRAGSIVRLALAAGQDALRQAGAQAHQLPTVFTSSGGDGHNCHELCQALALAGREVSPTRFSNSVHNAAAGYWSIGTGAMAESNVLCAFDASFSAGLLEAMTHVAVDQVPVLLVAYDSEYPQPLHDKRPIPDAFGVALVLTPQRRAASLAGLNVALSDMAADRFADPALETLRCSIPAARSLPLLRLLAARTSGTAILEYLDVSHLEVLIESCA
jgi:hypothetical protein